MYIECAIKSLANIAEGTIEHKKAVLYAGALEPLNELSKSSDPEISRLAQRAIYNLSNCKEELLPSSFLTSKM
uniref:Uncharacterized protein n=1 Tax=Panagrolaimus davidi TaxID=227884 RepID=A0A914PAF4_9BILA